MSARGRLIPVWDRHANNSYKFINARDETTNVRPEFPAPTAHGFASFLLTDSMICLAAPRRGQTTVNVEDTMVK